MPQAKSSEMKLLPLRVCPDTHAAILRAAENCGYTNISEFVEEWMRDDRDVKAAKKNGEPWQVRPSRGRPKKS